MSGAGLRRLSSLRTAVKTYQKRRLESLRHCATHSEKTVDSPPR